MSHTRLFPATALLAAMLVPGTAAATAPAAAATEAAPAQRCQGHDATLVGRPGRRLNGTAGRDVVVTNSASYVYTRGGKDLVCITGVRRTQVFTGDGADKVVNTQARREGWAALGPGADTYVGSNGKDTVYTHSMPGRVEDRDRDVVRTRGGRDFVATGGTRLVNDDRVSAGAGRDELWVVSWDNAGARLDGGGGVDHVWMMAKGRTPSSGAWLVDAAAGRISVDGRAAGRLHRWESFNLTALPGGSHEFRGSDADETVWLSTDTPVSADMGAGDDLMGLSLAGHLLRVGLLDGAAGTDRMVLAEAWGAPGGTFTGDLVTQRLTMPTPSGVPLVVPLAGIEDLVMSVNGSLTMSGDAGDNIMFGYSCDTRIDGGAGNDSLTADGFVEDLDCTKPSTLLGGDGDDTLVGGRYDDVLVGGSGNDVADGARGFDRCDAEVEWSCES